MQAPDQATSIRLPNGRQVRVSAGDDTRLIKRVVERFCPRWCPGGVVLYIGDTENKSANLKGKALAALGVTLDSAAKIPDVIVHDRAKNWLLLIEAVTSAGPVDGKRRKELKELFAGCKAGLVFVTAFENRRSMQSFLSQIAWESEVWIADDPEHMIHFNGERFLGPYPDVLPASELKEGAQSYLNPALTTQSEADAAHYYSIEDDKPPYRSK
jgi:hypothetical protein